MIFLRMREDNHVNVPVPKRHVPGQTTHDFIVRSAVHYHIPSVRKFDIGRVTLTDVAEKNMQVSIRK
jgi:hypothetical protein